MTYREAFEQWRRAYLEEHLEKAQRSVIEMSKTTGISRQNIYKLCEKSGVKVNVHEHRAKAAVAKSDDGGNAAWHALSDEAPR